MIAIESPTAARVAATAAMPSSRRRGSTRILSARKPSSRRRQRRLGPLGRRAAATRTRRRPGCRRARRRRASRPAARRPGRRCPTARPRAASSGRRGSRSSRAPGRGGRWPADPARRTGARTPRSRPSCRPTRCRRRPRRSRPGRSLPRTSARGTGSHAAGNGGSSGTTRRSRRIGGDAHGAEYRAVLRVGFVDSAMGRQYRSETPLAVREEELRGRAVAVRERCSRALVACQVACRRSSSDGLFRSWTRSADRRRRCSSTSSRPSPPGG